MDEHPRQHDIDVEPFNRILRELYAQANSDANNESPRHARSKTTRAKKNVAASAVELTGKSTGIEGALGGEPAAIVIN